MDIVQQNRARLSYERKIDFDSPSYNSVPTNIGEVLFNAIRIMQDRQNDEEDE